MPHIRKSTRAASRRCDSEPPQDNLENLTTEVLRLRCDNLQRLATGSRQTLITRPRAAPRPAVNVKMAKTDPFRPGTTLTIAKSNSTVCAVIALRDYLLPRNPSTNGEMLQNDQLLSRSTLNSNLRELLNILGYLEKEFAPHSFRIGAAATAAAANMPPWLIKTVGRWRSDYY